MMLSLMTRPYIAAAKATIWAAKEPMRRRFPGGGLTKYPEQYTSTRKPMVKTSVPKSDSIGPNRRFTSKWIMGIHEKCVTAGCVIAEVSPFAFARAKRTRWAPV